MKQEVAKTAIRFFYLYYTQPLVFTALLKGLLLPVSPFHVSALISIVNTQKQTNLYTLNNASFYSVLLSRPPSFSVWKQQIWVNESPQ